MDPAGLLLIVAVVATVAGLNYYRGLRGVPLVVVSLAALALSVGYVLLRGG